MQFTKSIWRVLLLTRNVAEGLQHTYVGTEHLLLGMLFLEGNVGSWLRHFNIKATVVEDHVRRIYIAQNYPVRSDLELALDLKIVLNAAVHDAHVAGKKALSASQLFVTMLDQPLCHACEILRQINVVDFWKMQQEFKIMQGGGPPARRFERLEFGRFTSGWWSGSHELPSSLSENARQALSWAKEFAKEHQYAAITSSHLLVGLIEVDGQAKRVLTYLGLDAAQVREVVKRQYAGSRVQPGKPLALSIDCEDCLIAAQHEGIPGENAIGTGHLLLGITLQPRCAALDVLDQFNISASRIQGQIIRKLIAE